MTSIDISLNAAVSSAPPTDAGASADTPAGASGAFAAMLDEAAGSAGESTPADEVDDDEDAADEQAALAMTSLLCIGVFVPPVVETPAAVDVAVPDVTEGDGEGESEAASALTATAIGGTIGTIATDTPVEDTAGAASQEAGTRKQSTATPDAMGTAIDTALGRDTSSSMTLTSSDATAGEGEAAMAAPSSSEEITGEPSQAAPTGTDAAPTSNPTRTSKPAHAEHAKAAQKSDSAPVPASTAAQASAVGESVDGAPSPSSRAAETSDVKGAGTVAARFARALERATAGATGESRTEAASPANAPTADQGEQSQTFGESTPDRTAQTFAAPRQAIQGGVAFTVTAPTPVDARMLASAVDAAGQVAESLPASIPERDVVAQLVQSMRMQFRDGIGEAVVKLKPEHLGSVQISLRIENGAIKATVQAELPAVRQWLESQQDTLKNSLADQGLHLERFVVEPDGERQPTEGDAERQRQQRRRHRRAAQADQPIFEVTV